MKKVLLCIALLSSHFLLLAQNVGIGTTTPASKLSVGASSQFQIDSTGNVIKINNATISFPNHSGVLNTVLINKGNGQMEWMQNLPSGAIVASETVNPMLDTLGYTLQSRSFIDNQEYYTGDKNGQWFDTITDFAPTNAPSNLTWSTNFQELVFMDSGRMRYFSPLNYNKFTGTYLTLANAIPLRETPNIISVGNFIYVFGGLNPATNKTIRSCYRYSTSSNTWTAIASMPDSVYDSGICANGSKIYIMGGMRINTVSTMVEKLFIYDIPSNTWTTTTLTPPYPNFTYMQCTLIGDSIVVYNGSNTFSAYPVKYYSITNNTWESETSLNIPNGNAHYSMCLDSTNKLWVTHSAGGNKFLLLEPYFSDFQVVPEFVNFPYSISFSRWYNGKLYLFSTSSDRLLVFTPNVGPMQAIFGDGGNITTVYYYKKN